MTFSVSAFLLLIIVLSADVFSAGFSYGMEKVKIPFYSCLCVSFISGAMLSASLITGNLITGLIPPGITEIISFLILLLIALYKIYDTFPLPHSQNPSLTTKVISQKINQKHREVLSLPESLLLSLALSADNVSVGFSYAFTPFSTALTLSVTSITHLIAFLSGILTGHFLSQRCSKDFSFLGALIFLLLAFARLF